MHYSPFSDYIDWQESGVQESANEQSGEYPERSDFEPVESDLPVIEVDELIEVDEVDYEYESVTLATVGRLFYGGQMVEVGDSRPRAVIGRGEDSDLQIPELCVSRAHATLEQRADGIYLVDHSNNGTTVISEDAIKYRAWKSSLKLQGHGQICLGSGKKRVRIDFAITDTWSV